MRSTEEKVLASTLAVEKNIGIDGPKSVLNEKVVFSVVFSNCRTETLWVHSHRNAKGRISSGPLHVALRNCWDFGKQRITFQFSYSHYVLWINRKFNSLERSIQNFSKGLYAICIPSTLLWKAHLKSCEFPHEDASTSSNNSTSFWTIAPQKVKSLLALSPVDNRGWKIRRLPQISKKRCHKITAEINCIFNFWGVKIKVFKQIGSRKNKND